MALLQQYGRHLLGCIVPLWYSRVEQDMEHQFKPTTHANCSHEFIIAVNFWIMETDNQIDDSFSKNLVSYYKNSSVLNFTQCDEV